MVVGPPRGAVFRAAAEAGAVHTFAREPVGAVVRIKTESEAAPPVSVPGARIEDHVAIERAPPMTEGQLVVVNEHTDAGSSRYAYESQYQLIGIVDVDNIASQFRP